MSHPLDALDWTGWGDPDRRTTLSPELLSLARSALGIDGDAVAPARLEEVDLPPSCLEADAAAELASVVGEANVRTDREARVHHTRGKSTVDLLRIRAGDATDAPDAVVSPGDHAAVLGVLEVCARHGIAVVPFGGGTSVVGGLTAQRGDHAAVLALDVRQMRALLELDEVSRIATLEPGLRGPEAERLLGERGYTLGHFPQSWEYASIGGFAAARSSGQASAGYGRFDERVVTLRVATPAGTLELGRAPRSAAGPDLRQLILGSEGAFGVITAVGVEVDPLPAVRVYEGWRLPDFTTGTELLRRLAQDGPEPTVLRLSDEVETALNLARPDVIGGGDGDPNEGEDPNEGDDPSDAGDPGDGGAPSGCLAIVGFEGTEEQTARARQTVAGLLQEAGAARSPGAGEEWAEGRYAAPYLRDALLASGALVETLETATFWSRLPSLYTAVREALVAALTADGAPPLVLCHISHVYRSGASLYFTVACAQGPDPISRWRAAKAAAGDAILAAGGTITHHHGVGTDHRAWFAREIGENGARTLRAVKAALDPEGILNPGVLIP